VCPLLAAALVLQDARVEEEAGAQALMLSRVLTLQDPFQGFPFTTTPGDHNTGRRRGKGSKRGGGGLGWEEGSACGACSATLTRRLRRA